VAKKKTESKKYGWVTGAFAFTKLDPQAIGEELEALQLVHGHRVPPEAIVEAASDPATALHHAFPWDDKQAAVDRRLDIARHLSRSVTVVIITPEKKEVTMRAFQSIRTKGKSPAKHTYTSTEYAMNDEELRGEVLRQALRELAAVRRKYSELNELAVVFAAIDKAMGRAA
jgi:hypothetical protein